MVALERQCWGNNQYSKHECSEIIGVPDSVSNDDLGKTTIKTFNQLDVAIDLSNIEDYDWLKISGPRKVIIKFARRKNANLNRKN